MALCTRAVTGPDRPAHQPIFVCDTCRLLPNDGEGGGGGELSEGGAARSEKGEGDVDADGEEGEKEPLLACICQSCASACHDGHDVYFVGVGPCTCDCPALALSAESGGCGCRLAEHSAREAERLGFEEGRLLNVPLPRRVPPVLAAEMSEDDRDEEGTNDDRCEDETAEAGEDALSQHMADLCLDCHASLGGYAYASFALPSLDDDACQRLIRQAEALTARSHDTFWVPENDTFECYEENGDGWCELEVLARQIYQRHVHSYSLDTPSDDQAGVAATKGGAEWWVQVKPPGTSKAPVDLHYDKDEVLAEKFGLGSFPTLSTVTYLTESKDNQPTVVFPHGYHDEEEGEMEAMLVSRARRGKHLVFDGRLLHGAPGHPALRGRFNARENPGDEGEEERTLRVTFLVNIWRTGRPAGVDVLPESIRVEINAAAGEESDLWSATPLDFRERKVCTRAVRAGGEGERIVLPFVSHGATWIDGEDRAEGEGGDGSDGAGEQSDEEGSNNGDEEEENGSDDESEEDDELVLVLPPLNTGEDNDDEADTSCLADTILLTFEDGHGARLVREGAVEEADAPDCPWKRLAAGNESEVSADDEHRAIADEFLAGLNENVPPFVASVVAELKQRHEVDVAGLVADHVCYRTDSNRQYNSLVEALKSAGAGTATLLVESNIGGRPIATFKLATPIEITTPHSGRTIDLVEIPAPKDGSPYRSGLEHVEFVIGDGSCASPRNGAVHEEALTAWMERHPSVPLSAKAIGKDCNPDVSLKMELGDYGKVSMKFHLIALEDVIKFETGDNA
ncbi:hypothetical protein ACHAXT_013303 [Thalassiosira profunda]